MATNISDFATHDMKVSYPVFALGLVVFMRTIGDEMVLWVEDEGPGYDYKPNGGRRSSGFGPRRGPDEAASGLV
jgi:hypothetical protein